MSTFTPLSFSLIEEGELEKDLNDALAEVNKGLLDYRRKFGIEAANKAKGEVVLKIGVTCSDAKEGIYNIRGEVSKKIPTRPPRVTSAIADMEQDGVETLFTRRSGTTKDDPRQMRLATEAGEAIDPETGEKLEQPNVE